MYKEEKEYRERIEELFSKHPTVQNSGFNSSSYKSGLEGMMALDSSLGHPWKSYRCIHVAGTNGEGSVSSMLAACLAANGWKVGLYTSPHLLDFRERIKIVRGNSFEMISKEGVWEFLEQYEKDGLSFFEITTGMAFWWFKKQKVDYAVIEVGLGGRLDSTNIISPVLSIITSIGLDHCSMLGNTLAQIAGEKAGIFKKDTPAIAGITTEQTREVFKETAERIGAPLYLCDGDPFPKLKCDLEGDYQKYNLRTVSKAIQILGEELKTQAIEHTSAITGLHARWERICARPEVICDIGHNPPALKLNFAQLQSSGRPLVIIYGVMADKDLAGIAPLMPSDAHYVLTAPAISRAMDVPTLQSRLKELRPELETSASQNAKDAVAIALRLAQNDPRTLVYIGGSTYVVADCLPVIEEYNLSVTR